MADLPWMTVALWTAGLMVVVCFGLIFACEIRDRRNRGMRVQNGDVYRERITRTLPDNWLSSFHDRDYK